MTDRPTAEGVSPDDDDANDAANDEVLAELRMLVIASDPVPPEAIAAARSALAWRTMDAELAELTADTSVAPQLAGVRGVVSPAMLTFEAPGLAVEVEVTEVGRARRLLGQLVPASPGAVEIRHGGGRVTVTADEVGRFAASGLDSGPVSLRCQLGTKVVETDWFLV